VENIENIKNYFAFQLPENLPTHREEQKKFKFLLAFFVGEAAHIFKKETIKVGAREGEKEKHTQKKIFRILCAGFSRERKINKKERNPLFEKRAREEFEREAKG
jgi:hypothetical protein